MGKYSTPITYKAARKPAQGRLPIKEYAPLDWSRVDVAAMIERHTSTRLKKKGNTQLVGACPYPDCSGDDDGFIVWPSKSSRGQHFLCRTCRRTGDLIKMLEEINGWEFKRCIVEIGLKDQGDSASGYARAEEPPETAQDKWYREQLAQLRYYYSSMLQAIAMERPQQYLQERGFTLADARLYGIGYFPLLEEMEEGKRQNIDVAHMGAWLGRIVFPLTDVGKDRTFAGRTLRLWVSGMSPAQHKEAIDAYNAAESDTRKQIRRVLKTSPCGYFGYEEAVKKTHLTFPEGEFDGLSLMVAGLKGVIAVGTSFPAKLIPLRVETVTLALDTDKPGMQAVKRLSNDLCNKGLGVSIVLPGSGKDWNDMHVQSGIDAIQAAFNPPEATSPAQDEPELVTIAPEPITITPARHPLADEHTPALFNLGCDRCGRAGEAYFDKDMNMWFCICAQLEDIEMARAGKPARIAARQKEAQERDVLLLEGMRDLLSRLPDDFLALEVEGIRLAPQAAREVIEQNLLSDNEQAKDWARIALVSNALYWRNHLPVFASAAR